MARRGRFRPRRVPSRTGDRNVTGILVLQSVISGLMIGAIYGLLGVGFSLVWGAMKVINIAHAAFAVLGAYLAYFLLKAFGVDPVLGFFVILPFLFFGGMVVYRFLIFPVMRARDIVVSSMVLTFGCAIVIENFISLIGSPDPRVFTTRYTGRAFFLGPFAFQWPQTVGALMALAGMAVLYVFLKKTHTGKALRASWQQPEAARLYGINLRRISMIAFGLAVASAGLGGIAMGFVYSFDPHTHNLWLIYIFLVVILGGVGNVLGTALAGLLIGLLNGLSLAFFPYQWVNVITFGMLILILLVRPAGLFRSEV